MAAWGYFYNGVLRKYIIMFGNMFNDVKVVRTNSSGEAVQTIPLPISYGPREKFLARINQDPSLTRQVAIQLPRLSFELNNMRYAPERGLNKTFKSSQATTFTNSMGVQYTPVPYDFDISLYGMFSNNEDAVQVVEQIAPFFRPEWTQSLKLLDSMDDYWDIATVFQDMSIEDTYDASFEERRAILYTWNFTVKGFLFGPVRNKGVIKRTVVDITAQDTNTSIATETGPQTKVVLTPGLLANGQPTANSTASIAWESITANTNYGYAFDNEHYFDGINRHEH